MTLEQRNEHIKRVDDGRRAKNFLDSVEWKDFIKPILDSFIKGLTDIRNLKSADIDSDKKASIEVKARKMAAEYVESIENLLKGYVIDGQVSEGIIERELNKGELYKDLGDQT